MPQLSRIVNFHKAVADPTRLRILVLLAQRSLHGQALAGKLGVSAPTITHHMAKLREAGLVREHRDRNTIYFTLDELQLQESAGAVLQLVARADQGGSDMTSSRHDIERERTAVLRNFFTADGRLKHLPVQRKKKIIVLAHLLQGLEMGRKYPEREINEFILPFHEDYATIRREWIAHQFLYRQNGIYELNPPELWAR